MIFAKHFLKLTNEELSKNIKGFSPEVEAIFKNYVWHGNLRELKNVVKRATLIVRYGIYNATVLPFEITNYSKLQFDETTEENSSVSDSTTCCSRAVHHNQHLYSTAVPEPVFTSHLK